MGDPGAARQDSGVSGAVSVLERTDSGWERRAVLEGATAGVERFGRVVALADDTAAVAGYPVGPDAEDVGETAGTIYVFERTGSGWQQETTIEGGPTDGFGAALAISEDTLVVGAPFADADEGAASVFARTDGNWERQTRFTPNDRYTDDRFGASVGVWQDVAFAAGRYSIVGIGRYEGRWTHRATVEGEALSAGGTVPIPVAVDAGTLLAGVPVPRLEMTPGPTVTETPPETTVSPESTAGATTTVTQRRTDTSTPTDRQSPSTGTPTPESDRRPPGRAHVFTLGGEPETASTPTETTRRRDGDAN